MKRILCLLSTFVVSCAVLTGCDFGQKEETVDIKPLVGTWYHTEKEYDSTYSLYEDMTYDEHLVSKGEYTIPMDFSGAFECEDGKVFFDTGAEYEYELSGNKMIFTTKGGRKIEYIKIVR